MSYLQERRQNHAEYGRNLPTIFQTVYKYLVCLTHNPDIAEDLTQETFCKAVDKIDTFKETCKLSVWLCQIGKNLWYNELKKAKKLSTIDTNLPDPLFSVDESMIAQEERKMIYQKIAQLEPAIKEIFYLRLTGHFSFKEISEIIGKSESWVRVNFYRGKQKLKEVDEYEK